MNNSAVGPEIDRERCGTEVSNTTLGRAAQWDYTFAFWALRLWLGFRALFVGVQKYAAYKATAIPLIDPTTGQPDASGVMVNISVKSYALANYAGIPVGLRDKFAHEPLFPSFVLTVFDKTLGPLFILTGIMLIIGLGTRVSLLVKLEAALQCLVDKLLHPEIHRRVNLDTSLQKIVNTEVAVAFEILKDIFQDRGRLEHLILGARDHVNRALHG